MYGRCLFYRRLHLSTDSIGAFFLSLLYLYLLNRYTEERAHKYTRGLEQGVRVNNMMNLGKYRLSKHYGITQRISRWHIRGIIERSFRKIAAVVDGVVVDKRMGMVATLPSHMRHTRTAELPADLLEFVVAIKGK